MLLGLAGTECLDSIVGTDESLPGFIQVLQVVLGKGATFGNLKKVSGVDSSAALVVLVSSRAPHHRFLTLVHSQHWSERIEVKHH